jgi:IS1 family transposase
LEVDEFWTCAGSKKHKMWLIYACRPVTGGIVSCVRGKRNYWTAGKLRDQLKAEGIVYDEACTDKRESFPAVFQEDNHIAGKACTKGIEGNNCRLRHRTRRAFRKTCCFSKKLFNHLNAFELAFFISIMDMYK